MSAVICSNDEAARTSNVLPLSSPWPQKRIDRDGCPRSKLGADQPAPEKMADGSLNSALGEPRVIRDCLMAYLDRPRTGKGEPAPQVDIDEECRRFFVMTGKVRHERFQHIGIQAYGFHRCSI